MLVLVFLVCFSEIEFFAFPKTIVDFLWQKFILPVCLQINWRLILCFWLNECSEITKNLFNAVKNFCHLFTLPFCVNYINKSHFKKPLLKAIPAKSIKET